MSDLKDLLSGAGATEALFQELARDEALAKQMLQLALKALGYNNHQDDRVSGEASFRSILTDRIGVEVCADIGCNIGKYSRALLARDPSLKVYAFDPSMEVVQTMRSLEAEFPDRLFFCPAGVGEQSGKQTFFFQDGESELGSFVEDVSNITYINNDSSAEVDIVTLDEYLLDERGLDRLDFLKIDTEGYEEQVLRGARRVIETLRPKALQIEFNWHQIYTGATIYQLSRLLPEYQLFQLLPDRIVSRDPAHPYSNIFQYSNFAFLRTDILEQLKAG